MPTEGPAWARGPRAAADVATKRNETASINNEMASVCAEPCGMALGMFTGKPENKNEKDRTGREPFCTGVKLISPHYICINFKMLQMEFSAPLLCDSDISMPAVHTPRSSSQRFPKPGMEAGDLETC